MRMKWGNECHKIRPVSVLLIFPDGGEEVFIAVDDVTEVQTPLTSGERGWIGLKGRLRGDAFDDPKIVVLVVLPNFQTEEERERIKKVMEWAARGRWLYNECL